MSDFKWLKTNFKQEQEKMPVIVSALQHSIVPPSQYREIKTKNEK